MEPNKFHCSYYKENNLSMETTDLFGKKKTKTKKVKQPREDRKVIHETRVKIDLRKLREIVISLKEKVDKVGWDRETPVQRSAFHSWNTVSKFAEEWDNGEDFRIIENVSGGTAGSSARVYYFPSITSYCKPFRECIVPITEGNKFLFFDLKAAEFFLNCVFCNETEAIRHYQAGEDIYLYYKSMFPVGLSRDPIKTTLIANMYNTSAYRTGINCGISETQAQRLLDNIAMRIPSMTMKKNSVIRRARELGYYSCPNGFDQSDMVKIADIDPKKGFNECLALSVYVQSALGLWMQGFIKKLEPRINGTILTVFDSCLLEVRPERAEAAKRWIEANIKPFRIGKICEGSNFLEAYLEA